MAFSKILTNYDATIYGMILSILAPSDRDGKKAIAIAEEIANRCTEEEIDRAKYLVSNIMELVQIETARVKNNKESEVE
tara:strand:- start:955 stop:1191 length:237 start_codon:yes stop_codon:yes gene_type:complete